MNIFSNELQTHYNNPRVLKFIIGGKTPKNGMMDKVDISIPDFFKSISLGYRQGACYFNLGLLHSFVNDSLAVDFFTKAVKEDPDNLKYKEKLIECTNRLVEKK